MTLKSDDPMINQLLNGMRNSGMVDKVCSNVTCRRPFITRRESNLCPPCQDIADGLDSTVVEIVVEGSNAEKD